MKAILERLGVSGSSGMVTGLWQWSRLALVLLTLLILGSWLPELAPAFISDRFYKGEGGIVIVDSPEVYSRERLINDRFRQVSWLEDELLKSPDLQFGNQAISDLRQIMGVESRFGSNSAGPPADGGEPNGGPADNRPESTVSPSERFRDIRAYREEIRTEMMETLLDDRHDIKGNTLYRLKFDTTVLPEENTDKLVVIQVKLARAEFCEPGTSLPPNRVSDSSHNPCINTTAIHDGWLRQTEEKINDAIEGSIRALKRRDLSTSEYSELVRYLQSKNFATISRSGADLDIDQRQSRPQASASADDVGTRKNDPGETTVDPEEAAKQERIAANKRRANEKIKAEIARSKSRVRNVSYWSGLSRFNPECVRQVQSKFGGMKSPDDESANTWERIIVTCPRLPVSTFYSINPESTSGGHDSQLNVRYAKLRYLLLRFYEHHLADTDAYRNFDGLHKRLGASIDRNLGVLPGDKSASGPSANHVFEYTAESQRDYFRTLNEIANAEIAEQVLLRYAIVGMWIDRYTYDNDSRLKQCQKLYDDKLEVFDPKSLSCIAHLEKTTCDDVDYCTVRVEARIPEARKKVICDDEVRGSMYQWCQVRLVFERLLKIDETYYSYAVTPKESAQRVLTIASERRQKQLALSLLASSASGLDADAVESVTRAISDSTTQLEQIQRKPLILSFGRGQPVNANDNMGNNRGIDFGWIIGPKYLFSGKRDGKVEFYHAPTQNSLSAVISVPSWWTVMNLEIDTCWISHSDLPNLKRIDVTGINPLAEQLYVNDLCDPELKSSSHHVDVDYLIRLPGSAEELPRKFGYEIERVPAISAGGVLADFYVGQENANLIIQGNELWRSTVVTLGHQKADNIEVLPNMKGIIATFGKIDIPSTKIKRRRQGRGPDECFVMSEVVVWTSEGRTPDQQLFARVYANPLLSPAAEDDKGSSGEIRAAIPEGFGSCTLAESSPQDGATEGTKKDRETRAEQTNPPSTAPANGSQATEPAATDSQKQSS